MRVPMRLHHYSFKDYLLVEEMSAVKHEYLDGEIYAMAGGTILHAALAAAILASFGPQLGDCRAYTSDLRIRALTTGLATYPDVTVVCGPVEADPESKDTVANPSVVSEVLSPSTIDYDLGEKFEHYRQIPSLKAVVYVWQDHRQIEVRARTGDVWRNETFGPGAVTVIEALACTLDVDALYNRAGG
ncbi:MAG TPA: Uma2 family endonuclease [Polyangia bacterium]|jgi:Uma2 family endonuclease